ncbi:MAG: NADPH-dependent F420 reductase [Actinomycetota bacterium]|nr:NADPH-dependent F420 reductase [Actinomycetota bacterium]
MRVTIIGAGKMGRGIGSRAVAGGHEVEIVDRDPGEARKLADELGTSAQALEPGDQIGGEVVVLALYYGSVEEAIGQYGGQLAGKVVVDITNPIDVETFAGLAVPPGSSSAQETAKRLPPGTPVVKAFNTTFAGTLVQGEVAGQQLDVLIAGDDENAKRKVASLAEGGGLRAIDVGPLARARQLEELGFLHIALQEPLGTDYASTVKLHW